jgi:hypothetical protein
MVCRLALVLKSFLITHLDSILGTAQVIKETEMLLKYMGGEKIYFYP